MQIPTNFSAAQAASIASQVSARDKDSALQSATSVESTPAPSSLEQSHQASSDRDAQGQGDGMGSHSRHQRDQNDVVVQADESNLESETENAIDDEPPDLIDLVC